MPEKTLDARRTDPQHIVRAQNLFKFLAELKSLSTSPTKDCEKYEQIIWFSDIPREAGCYTKAWETIGQPAAKSSDAWIEIKKPELQSPPELPDELELFVNEKEWRNSAVERPSLLDVPREQLIQEMIPNADLEPDYETHYLEDHEEIETVFNRYLAEQWLPWATAKRTGDSDTIAPSD